jgi:hypothetical protein
MEQQKAELLAGQESALKTIQTMKTLDTFQVAQEQDSTEQLQWSNFVAAPDDDDDDDDDAHKLQWSLTSSKMYKDLQRNAKSTLLRTQRIVLILTKKSSKSNWLILLLYEK